MKARRSSESIIGKILAGEPQKSADIIREDFERERLITEWGIKWFDNSKSLVSTPSMIAARVRIVKAISLSEDRLEAELGKADPKSVAVLLHLFSAKPWRDRGTHPF